ncbi:MAG: EAL domain-containing protein [Candidatus Omnitrophota bacterium]
MNKRILIVDDELGFVKIMTLSFQAHGYEIITASDGDEALKKAQEKPDLILLDISLPGLSGYEVCYKLRQDKTTCYIPIIMLTGRIAPEEKIEGLYVGADDYITKPFDSRELFARIEAIFRRTDYSKKLLKDAPRAISEIKRIIREESIIPFFQPIYYVKPRKLLGTEVLSRPPAKSYFDNPAVLFDVAFRLGMYFDLELACHKKALRILGDKLEGTLVCFNINPYFIEDERYAQLLKFYKSCTNPGMITLELTERTAILDFKTFYDRLKVFKEEGFKISIDDIGSGYASLSAIIELRPEFVKIDQHLIRGIYADPVRQNLFKAVITFCKDSGIISVAEGVETKAELDILTELGVDACQGYLLGRPQPDISWE